MASHSSILAWRISWTEGAWQGTIFRVSKSQTQLKKRSTHEHGTRKVSSELFGGSLGMNRR